MRKLSETFIKRLANELGDLLVCIKNDVELDLQIRGNYINVYYKGGNILKINPRSFDFDKMYFNDYNVQRSTDAKKDVSILQCYEEKRKQLLSLLPSNPKEYFKQAKKVMDSWDVALSSVVQHNEKKEQQQIAIANRKNTDYVVLDLEYAVSRNSDFSYNGKGKKEVPRFDIIAIHNSRLVVIELKKGLGAIDNVSGIKPHIDCFKHTIGRDAKGEFVKEMRGLLEQKQTLGILGESLSISNEKPIFIFAFADEEGKDEFMQFSAECYKKKYRDDLIYLSNHILRRAMKRDYYYAERKRQVNTFMKYKSLLFDNARSIGYDPKLKHKIDYILHAACSSNNLFTDIRQDALKYFKNHNIAWWQHENEVGVPSGHLVSSQIHCLNHLFALRTDDRAVKVIIEKATGMEFDKVLPSIIDNDPKSFISFEFVLDNDKLLGENDEGWGRGTLCTSIDAMVYAQQGDKKWLIPIEWKYTETYKREDKTNKKRIDRYADLIKSSKRLKTPQDGIPHSAYFVEPNYELMRQTLLCEQLVAKDYAVDFFHINIIPKGNTELREAVENEFMPMLTKEAKFKIIDPQEFLSPLIGDKKYDDLLKYLEERYWK